MDGDPLQDQAETDDDAPMDGAALLKVRQTYQSPSGDSDLDGKEIQESDTNPSDQPALSGFILSKWETVDPDQIEAQAMTTSKWDLLESSQDVSQDGSQPENTDYADTRNMSEERRTRLREIEVKAVQYQDELESGQRSLKSGWTVPQQVEHYRRKLLKKSDKERKEKKDEGKGEKHKKDWEKSERRVVENVSDEETVSYYKDM